jgi:hypothetical protein
MGVGGLIPNPRGLSEVKLCETIGEELGNLLRIPKTGISTSRPFLLQVLG